MVTIRTERLLLRRATMEDVESFDAIFSDPEAMRYWSTPPHTAIEQTRDWVASMVAGHTEASDDFVVTLNGEVIGKTGAYRLPEFGFILARAHWGKGFASEALAAFLDRRRTLGEPSRLTADVDPRNLRSIKLLEKHGFIETGRASGTWQVGDELCNSVYLALDL